MSNEDRIYKALALAFEGDLVEVIDVRGDQNHFKIILRSQQFEDLNRVAKSRLVYAALGDLAREIHAFEFELSTP